MKSHSASQAALQFAYRLLSYKGRSEKEMMTKLRMKGFDEPSIDSAMVQLRSKGFLDDERLASSLRRYAEDYKYFSAAATRKLLRDRGIARTTADDVTGDIDEKEVARRLIEKKLSLWGRQGDRSIHSAPQAKARRLYGILLRRGFPHEIIRKTLAEYSFKEDVE